MQVLWACSEEYSPRWPGCKNDFPCFLQIGNEMMAVTPLYIVPLNYELKKKNVSGRVIQELDGKSTWVTMCTVICVQREQNG